jgi:hypothetical protein
MCLIHYRRLYISGSAVFLHSVRELVESDGDGAAAKDAGSLRSMGIHRLAASYKKT